MGNRITITLHMLDANEWDALPRYVIENVLENGKHYEVIDENTSVVVIELHRASYTDTIEKIKMMLPRLSNTIVSISDSNDELNSKVFVPRFTSIVIN